MAPESNQPVTGKTYSLFGNQLSESNFYRKIAGLTDQVLKKERLDEKQLLEIIQRESIKKSRLRNYASGNNQHPRMSWIMSILHDQMQEYITGLEEHLKTTPFYKAVSDKILLTSREQYYLYMMEFELVNRLNIRDFRNTPYKLALLPYCIRESQTECRATADHIDYQCRKCIKTCQINYISTLLKEYNIEPYIWRRAKLKPLFKELVRTHGKIGILGIACIAELSEGMRKVLKAGLPVVGLPLNANRCIRWTDGFYENSVDLAALSKLLAADI